MDSLITPAIFILSFFVSSYGVGKTATCFFYKGEKIGLAFAATLGITIFIAFGGIFNTFHVAYPFALKSSLVLGITLAIAHLCLTIRNRLQTDTPTITFIEKLRNPEIRLKALENSALLLVILTALIFCTYFLMPVSAFNYHDDFHTYLDLPLQMLQTGSFQNNPFSPLGLHYLGGQSFMQSFSQVFFDIRYINAFDAIICFVLGMGVLVEFGKTSGSGFGSILLAVVLYLFINPLYVNTSALYSCSLMILGLVFSTYRLREIYDTGDLPEKKKLLSAVIPVALFYAALATLKATFAIFIILYFLICFTIDALWLKNKKQMLTANLGTVITAILMLVPWLAISSAKYVRMLQHPPASQQHAETPVFLNLEKIGDVFSTTDIFWGNSFPDYLIILMALGIIFIAGSYCLFKRDNDIPYQASMPVIAAAGACIISFFLSLVFFNHPIQGLIRYSTPIIIAVLPLTTLLAGRYAANAATVHDSQIPSKMLTQGMSFLFALHLVIAGTFLGSFIDRIERITERRTMISFPFRDSYLESMKNTLSQKREEQIRTAQARTEEGTKILAWVSTPFQLDFKRNNILLIKILMSPWRDIPIGADSDELLSYLRGKGIRHIIWEYNGFAVTSLKFCQDFRYMDFLYLINTLRDLASKTKIIYHQESILVLDIG